LNKKEQFFKNIGDLSKFDKIFWTDGSVLDNGIGSSACISYEKEIINPYDRNRVMYPLSTCILKPEGHIYSSYNTEKGGISSIFDHILSNRNKYLNAKILIGSDS